MGDQLIARRYYIRAKIYVIKRHGRGHSNCKIGRDVGLPESAVRNVVNQAGEIEVKCKFASAFVVCKHLQGMEVLQ
jgi:hypothetical protein